MEHQKLYLAQIQFAFATPTSSKIPFILDSSVSIINRGKIRVAANLGKKNSKGVALDKLETQLMQKKP